MAKKMQKSHETAAAAVNLTYNANPFEELDRFFSTPALTKEECPNSVKWWGVSNLYFVFVFHIDVNMIQIQTVSYPVMRLMARDYLPNSSFFMSCGTFIFNVSSD
jgi:hypothetical protein